MGLCLVVLIDCSWEVRQRLLVKNSFKNVSSSHISVLEKLRALGIEAIGMREEAVFSALWLSSLRLRAK